MKNAEGFKFMKVENGFNHNLGRNQFRNGGEANQQHQTWNGSNTNN